jgi:hypothetical protein
MTKVGLAGTLQDVVGVREASGYISVVGARLGERINRDYKAALAVDRLTRGQVAAVLVDLKRRIQGDFYVIGRTPSGSCWATGPARSATRCWAGRRCA